MNIRLPASRRSLLPRPSRALPGAFALLAFACTGSVMGPGGGAGPGGSGGRGGSQGPDPVNPAAPTYQCDESAVPDSVGLRRLTSTQYLNAMRDLVRWALPGDPAGAMAVLSALGPTFERFPEDARFRNNQIPTNRQMNQPIQQAHVEEGYAIAVAIGRELTTGARLASVVGSCVNAFNAQCVNDFIVRFGERALRRPLSGDDVAFYRTNFYRAESNDPAAWADLIAGLLAAPEVFYLVESGEDAVPGKRDVYRLNAYEQASRLSFYFTHTLPDDELWQAAKSGALLGDAEYARQVDRLMAKGEARRSTKEFFEDYLRVEDFDRIDRNRENATFRLFAGDNLPSSMLQQALAEDAVGMAQWLTWDKPNGSVGDLLSSEQSFARSPELAAIYGVPAWDGQGDPPVFPAEQERHGIFTRAGFVATGMVTTRPIIKGVHLRESWLCDHIPPPPPGASNTPVDTTSRTAREAVELITEQEGTTCRGCHQLYTNPIGFATEVYDGIGRFRTEEQVFDGETPTGTRPLNTVARPHIDLDDDTEVSGPAGLMRLVRESGKIEYCMAQHLFRYSFARLEDKTRDGCALESLRRAARRQGGSLRDVFREVAMMPEFRTRLITQ